MNFLRRNTVLPDCQILISYFHLFLKQHFQNQKKKFIGISKTLVKKISIKKLRQILQKNALKIVRLLKNFSYKL